MLPTNVVSFMKKMVATDENNSVNQSDNSNTGTFIKLKQTLSSSLLTAQDKVNKMSPRGSIAPESEAGQAVAELSAEEQPQTGPTNSAKNSKPSSRSGACRVCLKAFNADDFSKTCFECHQRVCEDCASYSKLDDNEDVASWRCSVCRRKMASRVCLAQDSTDSTLDVPVMEALVRRHSDLKLGSNATLGPGTGVSLALPRSPELRRHSDVSPASLKELEKLKGTRTPTGNESHWRKGRSAVNSRSNSPPRNSENEYMSRSSRRPSRVSRQHSYDDDIKSASNGSLAADDLGLGHVGVPRRASAYDVFAPGTLAHISQISDSSAPVVMPRRSSFRGPFPSDDSNRNASPSSETSSPVLLVADEPRTRRRGSQLPDIAALQSRAISAQLTNVPTYHTPALEDLEAPRRQTSLDGEAIKIVIHDVDSGPICASKRRVILYRDAADKAHRTRGFGMRVVGGKTGTDGRLFAYIVWTVPGGPAERGGLQQGDKVLEWNGISLTDRSFEEVCAVMDRTSDTVELLVEHATDFRMCDLLDENQSQSTQSGNQDTSLSVATDADAPEKSPSSPTRRKLPKTPKTPDLDNRVTGRVQLHVWYHDERQELILSLMAADDLAPRDVSLGYGQLPEAYAKVRVSPQSASESVAQSEISVPAINPIWNATLTLKNINPNEVMNQIIHIELWDFVPQNDPCFLGECSLKVRNVLINDQAVWYRLEDPRKLRSPTRMSPCRITVRDETGFDPFLSVDATADLEGCLLHPDHAWPTTRRDSSQSETLEVEVYQLSKDFSHSLPGSRRTSFQQEKSRSTELRPSTNNKSNRRRNSFRQNE